MTTSSKSASAQAADKGDGTWKPVAGTEQDTHSQTPGGGETSKHGTKELANAKTDHAAPQKGEQ